MAERENATVKTTRNTQAEWSEKMDYGEILIRRWSVNNDLTPLYIVADFDQIGELVRLWWFYSGAELISPANGMCDNETIAFFFSSHDLSFADRLLLDQRIQTTNRDELHG